MAIPFMYMGILIKIIALYIILYEKALLIIVYQAYHMFDKVVKLTVYQRVQGITSEQVQFRDLFLRLCKGDSTVDDWKLLLNLNHRMSLIYAILLDFSIVMKKLQITIMKS